ncbi:MAG: hypothetical protein HZA90_05435 [Verrucomicrobia bacterium]|nr:hypothetical protein [Verrucomicrobiota bacterium]
MPNHRWILAAACLWLCAAAPGWAAASSTIQRGGVSYSIDVFDSENGLPQNSVLAIAQTRDGYLWLGTLNGLARFDGLRFTVFDENNTPELPSSQITRLFGDSHGNLWIGAESGGVSLIQNGHLTSVGIGQGGREGRLAAACEDAAGAVWLYTASGELWRYHEGRYHGYLVEPGRSSGSRSLIAEKDGPVWVGTDANQYALSSTLDTGSMVLPVETNLPPRLGLDFLLASRRGGYWRLADGRVQRWRMNQLEADLGPFPWGLRASAVCEDHQGNLVVGTLGAGLFWFDANGNVSCLSTNEGLSHNYILSLHVDREGSLWVGTDGSGLNRIKRQAFDAFKPSSGKVVQSVCEDEHGGLWFGANNGWVNRWTNEHLTHFEFGQGLLSRDVLTVFVDQKQRLWAGTKNAGLFQWREGRFYWPVSANYPSTNISSIHQDRGGVLWFGTGGGLARWDEKVWRVFTTRDGLPSNVVRALADDREGALWIGTEGGGLCRMRGSEFTSFRKQDSGIPGDTVSALCIDDDGVLWIGTSGNGLARFHEGRWTRYSTRDGLAANSVSYLIEDGLGFLWIGSNAGLMRVPKKSLNDFAGGLTNVIACRTYRKQDGLPTSECSSGSQPGPCRTRDGRLWFPTIKGLASVDPAALKPNPFKPPVVIESVLIDDLPQNTNLLQTGWSQELVIPAGAERLEIRYTSLNLASPERARFRYWLDGHETKWTEAGSLRVAHYSKLPPGRFRFQVIACNEDGEWNETGSSLAITVEPPFWRTWWFLSASALGFIGSIIGVVHYFSTQKLQRQLEGMRQKEALEKERSRIARDLHDQLGANLTQISLLSDMAEADKSLPEEVEAHARQITQTARDTTRSLDEIVWAANPANDTLEGLINYACKYAQEYLALAGLRYRLEAPPQLPASPVPPELRHNVFLAFKESVNNVVKHAQAKSVWVRLKLEPAFFTLEVQDDGRGVSAADQQKGRNGLRNMRQRMEDVGGSFSISPAPEGGALVRLTAPIGRNQN